MSLGASLALIAVGAILRYAVTWRTSDVDIPVVGLILMIVGIVGLIISVAYMIMAADRRRDAPVAPPPPRDRDPYR
jgi:beta-lactamase regulating signal transducer with metallopeptidase domain